MPTDANRRAGDAAAADSIASTGAESAPAQAPTQVSTAAASVETATGTLIADENPKAEIVPIEGRDLRHYNPEDALKTVYAADSIKKALEHKLRNEPDDPFVRQELREVIKRKVTAQANYGVWRAGVLQHGRGPGRGHHKAKKEIAEQRSLLPSFDPGDDVAFKWRKKYCRKVGRQWQLDESKIELAVDDAWKRATRLCEVGNGGTRGTLGTGKNRWFTPEEIIEKAREVFGGEIDLDPASEPEAQKIIKAKKFYTEEDDGLKHEWQGRVFLNGPYGRQLHELFIHKLWEERQAGRVTEAITLTHNFTDTGWFQDGIFPHASVICFTRGRVAFYDGDEIAAPTEGQALSYFGPNVARFVEVFRAVGSIVFTERGLAAMGAAS
jgi:ParB family chromosome partitioning protein